MNQCNLGLDKISFMQITYLWNTLPISTRSDVELVPFLQVSLSEVRPCQYCYLLFLLTFFFSEYFFLLVFFYYGVPGNGYQLFLRGWLGGRFTYQGT